MSIRKLSTWRDRSQCELLSRAGDRSWNLALLLPAEAGRRNRRTIDATFLVLASLVTGFAAVLARLAPDVDAELAEALASALRLGAESVEATFVLALAFALLIIGDAVVRRRWILVRDLCSPVLIVSVVGAILGPGRRLGVASRRCAPVLQLGLPRVSRCRRDSDLRRRRPRARATGPACSRSASSELQVSVPRDGHRASVTGAGSHRARPGFGCTGPTGAWLGGWCPTQSGCARPSPRLAFPWTVLRIADSSGSARPSSSAIPRTAGRSGSVCSGRDAQDTQRLARRWQLLAYRDPPRSVPVGRLEQVEHEAVATLMAAPSGVRVPEVVDGGTRPRDGRGTRHGHEAEPDRSKRTGMPDGRE